MHDVTSFHVIAILISLTALFSYINHRYVHLHPTLGVMLIALLLSLAIIGLGHLGFGIQGRANRFLAEVPFGTALLQWMLAFLLFSGALTVDIDELKRHAALTATLATVGTALSTLIVGLGTWAFFRVVGASFTFHDSLLLGAVLSPTDPVAILGVMRRAGAPRDVENIIAAESLFNDGVGVVLFLALLGTHDGASRPVSSAVLLFLRQFVGGAALGVATGLLVHEMLKRVDRYQVTILLTLALVMGTYALAETLHVSGPIAVVVAGLFSCNRARILKLPSEIGEDLGKFWDLLDELLNAALFLLIGMQVLVLTHVPRMFLASLVIIPIVLLARWLSVGAVLATFALKRGRFGMPMVLMLTWGGLRGGLAVAMALSLPPGPVRDRIVLITYVVVLFSILVQGTTAGAFFKRVVGHTPLNRADSSEESPANI